MAEEVKKEKATRRSSAELLEEAEKRVIELRERVKAESISAEEKEKVKLAKRPLINAVNRIKTLEEVEQWVKALDGVVDFKNQQPVEVKNKQINN